MVEIEGKNKVRQDQHREKPCYCYFKTSSVLNVELQTLKELEVFLCKLEKK
jgi:hypothetical protein